MTTTADHEFVHFEYHFDQVLKEKECHDLFCTFATKTHNDENTKFSKAMQELKVSKHKDKDAAKMFSEFVQNGSKYELNVPDAVRIKCHEFIQNQEYDMAFAECQVAVDAHLNYLFALFKSSDLFSEFLKHKSKSYLKVIGVPKKSLVQHKLDEQDLERCHFEYNDFILVQELSKSFEYWKVVYADQQSALLYSSRVFQTEKALAKHGFMSPFKTSFTLQCQCTLQQLLSIVVTPVFLKQFYPIGSIETIHLDTTAKHPCAIIRATLNLSKSKLLVTRHICEIWTIHQTPTQFSIIRKCCQPKEFQVPANAVQQRNLIVATFQQLMPNLFHIDHVALCNLGGNLAFGPASQKTAMKFMKLMRGATLKGFKNVVLKHVEKLHLEMWQPQDELKLLQIVQDASKIKV